MQFDCRFVYWHFVGRAGKALRQLEEETAEDDAAAAANGHGEGGEGEGGEGGGAGAAPGDR